MARPEKRWDPDEVGESEFEVVTGMMPGDNPAFATHGHPVRFRFV